MIAIHRIQRRRWAARMLLVWLFAVFASVANACVLESAPARPALAAANEHTVSHDHHRDRHRADETNCQEFCDQASLAVPSASGASDQVASPVPAIGLVVAEMATAQTLRLRRIGSPPRSGALPIQIAFLRLAL